MVRNAVAAAITFKKVFTSPTPASADTLIPPMIDETTILMLVVARFSAMTGAAKRSVGFSGQWRIVLYPPGIRFKLF